jgi:hypothetical protein
VCGINLDGLNDLFAGIGGIRLGFEHYGRYCVFSSYKNIKGAFV